MTCPPPSSWPPRTSKRRVHRAADGPGESAGREPAKVLVVDDGEDAADLLAELLRVEGFDARVAYDGPSAIRLAREWTPDHVVLDIGLPEMDGYEVAEALRGIEALARTRIIALTGYGRPDARRHARMARIDHYLVKPVEPEELFRLLRGSGPPGPGAFVR